MYPVSEAFQQAVYPSRFGGFRRCAEADRGTGGCQKGNGEVKWGRRGTLLCNVSQCSKVIAGIFFRKTNNTIIVKKEFSQCYRKVPQCCFNVIKSKNVANIETKSSKTKEES